MGRAQRLRRTSRWAWQKGKAQDSSLRLLHGFPLLLFSDTRGTRSRSATDEGQTISNTRGRTLARLHRGERGGRTHVEAMQNSSGMLFWRPPSRMRLHGWPGPAGCSSIAPMGTFSIARCGVPKLSWLSRTSGRPESSAAGEPPTRRAPSAVIFDARKRRLGLLAPDPLYSRTHRTPSRAGRPSVARGRVMTRVRRALASLAGRTACASESARELGQSFPERI